MILVKLSSYTGFSCVFNCALCVCISVVRFFICTRFVRLCDADVLLPTWRNKDACMYFAGFKEAVLIKEGGGQGEEKEGEGMEGDGEGRTGIRLEGNIDVLPTFTFYWCWQQSCTAERVTAQLAIKVAQDIM